MGDRYWDTERERWVYADDDRRQIVGILEDAITDYDMELDTLHQAEAALSALESAGFVVVRAYGE
jgi:hypothetical protein